MNNRMLFARHLVRRSDYVVSVIVCVIWWYYEIVSFL
jgi:hypothetical protein